MTSKKELVWEKAKPIRSKPSGQYRLDPYGHTIRRDSYGKHSATGWEIDHIKPKSKGGSDHPRNLQALHWATNLDKADSMVKKSRHSKANK